jgi:hypothetical protein
MAKAINQPRISVNKLAEFITAKASRQRQILRDQKFPQDYKVTYYKEASEAISICIGSNIENTAIIERTISNLEQQKRGMKGIYQHCSEKHLHRYVAEFDFRYNNRVKLGVNDADRTECALKSIVGKRLTYQTVGMPKTEAINCPSSEFLGQGAA